MTATSPGAAPTTTAVGPGEDHAATTAGPGADHTTTAADAAEEELDEDGADADGADADDAEPAAVTTVRSRRAPREEERGLSDFRIDREILRAAPRHEGAEVLRAAPGLYIGRGEGPAVAHSYMLRGFDADHGQDIAFHVGGLPINLPSHIHGQGYADLGFLIGETVREMHVKEGIYDPRQGDFAVAGSIDLTLGVPETERGIHLSTRAGSWRTWSHRLLYAPRGADEATFGAVHFTQTDGFGEQRAAQSGSGLFQYRFGEGPLRVRAIGLVHAARADLAGVLRYDDVQSGRVCWTCAYPDPSARAQNAMSQRLMLGLFADYRTTDGADGQAGLWLGYDNFRLQENFTGYIERSRLLHGVSGRGDLIEQQNQTLSAGLTARHRSASYRPTDWARATLEVGAEGRLDLIDQAQNLLDAAVRRQTWDRRIDARIRGLNLGAWGDLEALLTPYVTARAGLRADLLSYEIDDTLGNRAPITRAQDSSIPGFRRSALGFAAGPRLSLEGRPLYWLSILAAYGEGYRSPQARLLEDGERAPFAKVRSTDVGLRFDWGAPLQLTVGGYYTQLSEDIAFDASEGSLQRVGATRRLGAVLHALTRPLPWLVGSLSVTFVEATLREPPPPTAEEPQPPFTEGQQLPFVAPLVIRADLGTHHTLVERLGAHPLTLREGLGFSFLSPRPLPYGDFSDPVALLDASAALTWGPVELSFELFNALNTRYAAVEYAFPSDWSPQDGVRPRTPHRHTAAGAPLSWMLSLGLTL